MPNSNSNVRPGGGGGGGGGLYTREPPDIFTGANLAACVTARNAYFGPVAGDNAATAAAKRARLAEFQSDQFLAIILDPDDSTTNRWETYAAGQEAQPYNAAHWLDRGSVAKGDRGQRGLPGPGPTYSNADPLPLGANAAPGTEDEAARRGHIHPWDGLATDDELSGARQALESALLNHTSNADIHLSPQQARDIARSIVGLSVTGNAANRQIVAIRASGQDPIVLNIPAGDGGGTSPGSDVHLEATGSLYNESSQMLTLALSDGTTIQIDMAALVTQAELTSVLAGYARLTGAVFTGVTEGLDPATAQGFATRGYVGREIANALAGSTPDARSNQIVFARLGQPNLATSDVTKSGVLNAAGNTTSRLIYSVPDGQDDSGEQNVRWDPDIDGHSLPDGASYAEATGILTLPHGVWIIEAVMILEVRQTTTQVANVNTAVDVEARLYEGGEFRYAEGVFFWGQVDNHPTLSVTGSLVIPKGSTDTLQVRLLTTPHQSASPNAATVLENAHMEAIRLGDAPPVVVSNAYIAWSPDTDFTSAEFLAGTAAGSGQSGVIPTQNGFAYLGLWLSADHWDAVRQIDIDHGPNGFSDLAAPVDLTINGVAGQYRRYATRLAGDVAGGATLRWR